MGISDSLLNKTAIVTGSSSGLGRAIALLFAAQGTRRVICADLKPDSPADGVDEEQGVATHELISRRYGAEKAVFVKTDVGIGHDVGNCVREAVKSTGRLDM